MTEQPALSFLAAVRGDADLRARVEAMGPTPSLAQLTACSNDAGFACSTDDLAEAFRADWVMRWVHHGRK